MRTDVLDVRRQIQVYFCHISSTVDPQRIFSGLFQPESIKWRRGFTNSAVPGFSSFSQ
jgi:hypothetical protein